MCRLGHEWAFFDMEPCYVGIRGLYEECRCPIASCTPHADGTFGCEYTPLFFAIVALLWLLWWLVVFVYLRVQSKLREEEQQSSEFPDRLPCQDLFDEDVRMNETTKLSSHPHDSTQAGTFS